MPHPISGWHMKAGIKGYLDPEGQGRGIIMRAWGWLAVKFSKILFNLIFLQVCGTARHGLVRLWDMRHAQPVQMYHVKHPRSGQSSPVYSVAFDQSNLYVALDQCLSLVSFVNPICTSRKTNYYNNKVVYYRWKKVVKTMYSIGFCIKRICYATS